MRYLILLLVLILLLMIVLDKVIQVSHVKGLPSSLKIRDILELRLNVQCALSSILIEH